MSKIWGKCKNPYLILRNLLKKWCSNTGTVYRSSTADNQQLCCRTLRANDLGDFVDGVVQEAKSWLNTEMYPPDNSPEAGSHDTIRAEQTSRTIPEREFLTRHFKEFRKDPSFFKVM